jgi:hypothetical protein
VVRVSVVAKVPVNKVTGFARKSLIDCSDSIATFVSYNSLEGVAQLEESRVTTAASSTKIAVEVLTSPVLSETLTLSTSKDSEFVPVSEYIGLS